MKYAKYYLAALAVILLDQAVKLAVHYNMEFGQVGEIPVLGDWFKLHYTLNPGMAFGIKFGSEYGKLLLTLFRVVAVAAIGSYLYYWVKQQAHSGFAWCIALILGGAVGNVIDSTFYGVLFNNAPAYIDQTPPLYPWFYGQVIDMFYVDIWQGYVSEQVPLIGGQYWSLWPIFNVADASIFVGVTITLLFQGRFFPAHTQAVAPSVKPDENSTLETVGK